MTYYFASLEFLPTRFSTSLLETLRHYATILEEQCQLGPGKEIDSSHYVEYTYFAWKVQDCSIDLFWSDEAKTSEWLWITITCQQDQAKNMADKILNGLKPFMSESKIYLRPTT